jgi:hypothetical protein
MGEESNCTCDKKHDGHLCVLRSKGMIGKIARQTSNPNVACYRCGEEANSEENVCSPIPLFI